MNLIEKICPQDTDDNKNWANNMIEKEILIEDQYTGKNEKGG